MYATSISFIKAQNPRADIDLLIELYRQELEYQQVAEIRIEDNIIYFTNNPYQLSWNKFAGQFASFTSGRIVIESDEYDYHVLLEADAGALLTKAGVAGGIVTLLFLLSVGINMGAFIFGGVVFGLFAGIGYILLLVNFPVYFVRVRNDIERILQSE